MARILPNSLLLLSFLLTVGTSAAATGTGFSLELIHRFPANLSISELARTLLQQSQSRTFYIKQSIVKSKTNTTTLRPPVHVQGAVYLVSLTIGTGQGSQSYYLEMDTGSGLTWIQCQPCNPCFPQSAPKFDPPRSPTYQRIAHDDPLCVPPYSRQNDRCTYTVSYADGFSVSGIISRETFTFQSSTQQPELFPGLVFGCTHSSIGDSHYRGDPAGIFGLAPIAESFITQLSEDTRGRFSYCLFPYGRDSSNYLRFGDDIIMNGPVQRTPLLIRKGLYYLHLHGISINGQLLDLPPGIFELRPDGTGGCIMDSGASITHMIDEAFDAVELVLVRYFQGFNLERVEGKDFGFDGYRICYRYRNDFNSFPYMTLHFERSNLKVERNMLFSGTKGQAFCLMAAPDNSLTFIGAYQQFQTRFTYDIIRRELSFVPEDCARNA